MIFQNDCFIVFKMFLSMFNLLKICFEYFLVMEVQTLVISLLGY